MKPDKYDQAIIRELVINPRLSDNKVSKITKIPVKTVNRKRKVLEDKGIIRYYTHVDNTPSGTADFSASVLYVMKFRHGIYREQFMEAYDRMPITEVDLKHISHKWLSEKDGHLILMMIIESRKPNDILEIFNAEIMARIEKYLGPEAVFETLTLPLSGTLQLLHNYMPEKNMKKGTIAPDWPKDLIFVTE